VPVAAFFRIVLDKYIAVPARLVALIERRYDEIIAGALAFHESQRPFSPGNRKKRRKHRSVTIWP